MERRARAWEAERLAATAAIAVVAFGAAVEGSILQGMRLDPTSGRIAFGDVLLSLFWGLGFPLACVAFATSLAHRREWTQASASPVVVGTLLGEMAGLHLASIAYAWVPFWAMTAAATSSAVVVAHVTVPSVVLSRPGAGMHLLLLTTFFAWLFGLCFLTGFTLPDRDLVPTFASFLAVPYFLAVACIAGKLWLSSSQNAVGPGGGPLIGRSQSFWR